MLDTHSYWRLLCLYWKLGSFIVVEQDVVPTRAQIDTLWACPQEWCAHRYQMDGIVESGLGCTKFHSSLLERTAGLPDAIIDEHRHWQSLDAMVIGELHRRGFVEHIHEPAVLHLHDYKPPEPRRRELTKLHFIGDGTRYLNGIPAADFETWDPETVAICVESGLYEAGEAPERPRRGRPPKASYEYPLPSSSGVVASTDKLDQPDYVTKFVPFEQVAMIRETIAPVDLVESFLTETPTDDKKEI